jgi:transcription-repair coupling factor (superfamily II helicase)
MPRGAQEIKFSAPLAHAFEALKHASSHPGSVQVLCLPRSEWVEEFQSLLGSLIDAEFETTRIRIDLSVWPAWEQSPYSPISSSITQKIDRLRTLSRLSERSHPLIILATADSWSQPTLPEAAYRHAGLELEINEDTGYRDDLKRALKASGYSQTDLVEEPGQFALRGEILDIFDPAHPLPFRIEFFDTVPESIRNFHPETQRTIKSASGPLKLKVRPAEEVLIQWDKLGDLLERIKEYCDHHQISRKVRDPIFENVRNGFLPEHFRTWFPFVYDSLARLEDHLPEDSRLLFFEPEQQKLALEQKSVDLKKDLENYPQPYWITPGIDLLFPGLDTALDSALSRASLVIRAIPDTPSAAIPLPFEGIEDHRLHEQDVRERLEDGYLVWIGTRGTSHQERMKFLLGPLAQAPGLRLLSTDSGSSLDFLTHKTLILSETLFFGSSSGKAQKPFTPTHPRFEQTDGLEFHHHEDLAPGDLIVHAIHGVGKYLGLQELTSGSQHLGEYLLIEYSGGDKLYLPVYRLNTIQRYVSSGQSAALDRLGTGQFEKAKQKARESAKKLAINLIEIYAKRALMKGPQFDVRGEPYFEFCDQFEFTETEGQLKATQDVLNDLEAGKLLDRLVCGDVGFGKTEVAMRAAFQAVQSGYQVALLVPTTLLAFQHEQSFRRRMKEFPIRVESISRFKTKKIQHQTLKDLKDGKIDVLVGTHRILSKDVEWNRLGLLIVDEEHRFGVEHKEKIKAIQADTHTLTLTATPIPRTLNMAISGLKDISVIKTPPTNRQPIKTFVSGYSPELVKTAIETELARGGQVFYLYNRVQSIHHMAQEIQKLVPHARILVAHGQMSEAEIESKMIEFYQGQAQVLVCTTIIESGIDVPNAGTILIHRADQLGLAQLYQIRGRVGRSHRRACAYLLVDEERNLTQEARMRLDVLQRFVELGSGFQIASHDLEIRGGGNLLGGEQSGHIASVGLDLFTELLEEAIQELKGKKVDIEERHFEPEIQVPVVCEISTTLVPDSKVRLSLYRRISMARTHARVDSLEEEFQDRFGVIPAETENLFWLIRLKNLIKLVGIEGLAVSESRTSITVRKSSLIEIDEVMKLYAGPKSVRDPRVQLTPDSKIVLLIPFRDLKSHLFELENFLHKIAPKAFENVKSD